MTTTPPARKPQDRQPKKSDRLASRENPPTGHDLLKPVARMRSREQSTLSSKLTALFERLGIDFKAAAEAQKNGVKQPEQEIDVRSSEALDALGDIGEVLEQYAIDDESRVKFIELDTGAGANKRVLDLAMWYLAELGESESSAS